MTGEWTDGVYYQWIAGWVEPGLWYIRFNSHDGARILWHTSDGAAHVEDGLHGSMDLILEDQYMKTLRYHRGTVIVHQLVPYNNIIIMEHSLQGEHHERKREE